MRSHIAGALIVSCVGVAAATAQHAGDIWVGRNADGQIGVGGYPVDEPVLLAEASGPLYGWSGNNPGFDHLIEAEGDLQPLESGAQIRLRVIDMSPAFRVIDDSFQFIDEPGDVTLLGGASMHVHLTFQIVAREYEHPDAPANPDFDPDQTCWQATFELVDTGSTGYETSEPFTMTFTYVECSFGDVNGDGAVNAFDIDPFVEVLVNSESASAEKRCAADANRDGVVNAFDIDAFVLLLVGG